MNDFNTEPLILTCADTEQEILIVAEGWDGDDHLRVEIEHDGECGITYLDAEGVTDLRDHLNSLLEGM